MPFARDPKPKIESKAIVGLKKIDINTRTDIEKRLLVNSKKLEGKGPEKKIEVVEKPIGNPGEGPEKKTEPSGKPLKEVQ